MQSRITLVAGDITQLAVDAIVTAANEALAGGHGVDGAVHRAAGPELFAECQTVRYCAEGDAKITGGYKLKARHVIHTVGPVWEGGDFNETDILRSCYSKSLELAAANAIRTIAFPCIATGAHDFPNELACDIAVSTVQEWIRIRATPETITFCCFDDHDYQLYERNLKGYAAT
jgi:O-acetyl-ADP-ribose deacetylase (regulator of RNase III)